MPGKPYSHSLWWIFSHCAQLKGNRNDAALDGHANLYESILKGLVYFFLIELA